MRYLGLAWSLTGQYHVKVLIVTEIIARTAKNIFLETVSSRILLNEQDSEATFQRVNKWIVDFLNLFFGNSDETSEFFSQILYPRASDYFGISVEDLESVECHPVALYNLFIEHCNIKKKVNSSKLTTPQRADRFSLDSSNQSAALPTSDDQFYKRLFKTAAPFGDPNISHTHFKLSARKKGYLFRTLPMRQVIQLSNDYKKNKQADQAIKACQLRR
jgi:hypothetical protein